jgi:asparagine synthase (glutamine-hydrolysing)
MCGIAGFWNRNGEAADEAIVQRMLTTLTHRGPDDSFIRVCGEAGLGFCRLSILDLDAPADALCFEPDQAGVLVYNGEVYNFRELRSELEKLGHIFRGTCDAEVVLHALREWGPERAVPKFNGMFALAYYDEREKVLWLARDRAGIKPLCFSRRGPLLAFASESKALFEHPQIPCRPDMHSLTTQLMHSRLTGNWTPFENVQMVTPGTIVKITPQKEETITYFDLIRDLVPQRIVDQAGMGVDALARQFESILRESVRSHLVSDAPLAMMCSGGLDSSLLTAMAAQERTGLSGYVADIEHTPVKEVSRAREVCRHLGVSMRPVAFTREDFLRDWPLSVYHNDRPNYFPQNLAAQAVCRAARQDGVKVLVGGEGADELFGGYAWQSQSRKNWMAYRLSHRLIQWLPGLYGIGKCGVRLYAAKRMEHLQSRPFERPSRLFKEMFFNPRSFALDGAQRPYRAQALFEKLSPVRHAGDRAFLAHSFEDFYAHLQTSLRSTDKMAMAHSIEMRVPFVENRVIDFGLHTPVHAKLNRGRGKWIVKRAAEAYLPKEIIHAPKVGFGITSSMWQNTGCLLRNGVLAELFKWDRHVLDELLGHVSSKGLLEFHLVSMELWGRLFLTGETPEQLSEELLSLAAEVPRSC